MKACGITAEFNPLHNGHEYIMKEARRLTDCDAVVVAMSGNYVQRGEPAIIDKWARTEAALSSGADLVIEIPAIFCLSDAGRYAHSSVTILESLGCTDYICFGSGSGDDKTLCLLTELIKERGPELKNRIQKYGRTGQSYPVAREIALLELLPDDADADAVKEVLGNSNDVLALEYMISATLAKPVIIKRVGSDYDAAFDDASHMQSAGGIRELIKTEGIDSASLKLDDYIPQKSLDVLNNSVLTYPDDWSEILRYAVLSSSPEEMDRCPSGGEGLGNLLKKAVNECETWDDIIMHCKSKRYTYTRLSRLAMQIILGINNPNHIEDPEYIRVLGFNERGRELISYIKKNELCRLPVISNINKDRDLLSQRGIELLDEEVRYTDLYNMVTKRDNSEFSDHIHKPVNYSEK